MKGPGLRIEMDVRQVWRCPRCGGVALLPGHVVAHRCSCCDDAVWMKLEGQPPRRKFPLAPSVPLPENVGEETAAGVEATSIPPAALPESSPEPSSERGIGKPVVDDFGEGVPPV